MLSKGKSPGRGTSARRICRLFHRSPVAFCRGWVHRSSVQSYVTEDKIYCVYIAPNKEMVLEHAKQGGFPANSVAEVKRMIDPTTAE
jgi:hypothetical protein